MTNLGVIGGSGFYQMKDIKIVREHDLITPFGKPSDVVMEVEVGGKPTYFLPRHGRGHRHTPSEVNYRANIHAMKQLGVTHLLAVSAVGIMREDIVPGDMVIPDQLFDRTKGIRASTFFSDGVVGHVSFADPICPTFAHLIASAAKTENKKMHQGGTYVCMEGPQFSTRAESRFYRETLSPAVIGMTALPEAKLAREAEMCYAILALATDYDCWHETEDDVSVDAVIKVVQQNTQIANRIVLAAAGKLAGSTHALSCSCHSAAKGAIMTAKDRIPAATKERLALLFGRYFG